MLSNTATFVLIALGTVIGLAGTDLVLPAIPGLPSALNGDAQTAQYVLAAFAAGTGIGLLVYGELGTRFRIGSLLVFSLSAYAIFSATATLASDLVTLSVIRFLQGLVSAGPAVFAPVMIKAMYDDTASIAALGRIGSIESITPALAPLLGAWLLTFADWKASFYLTAIVAAVLTLAWLVAAKTRHRFDLAKPTSPLGYGALVKDLAFIRHALSQAFTLGALLIIVFAAPAVITRSLGGDLSDFITMQVIGIAFFILAANTSHLVVKRFGTDQTILTGTTTSALGCISIFCLGLLPQPGLPGLWFLFIFVNIGLGLRGPPGFFKALQAAGENESRGSALIILFAMLTAALGTAIAAPYVDQGLTQVALLASVIAVTAALLSIPARTADER